MDPGVLLNRTLFPSNYNRDHIVTLAERDLHDRHLERNGNRLNQDMP